MGTEQTTTRKDGYTKHQEAEAAHPDARKGAGWEKHNLEMRPWYELSSCAQTPIQGLLLSRQDFAKGKFGPSAAFIIRLTEECLAVKKDGVPEIYPVGTEVLVPVKAKLVRLNDLLSSERMVEARITVKGKQTVAGSANTPWDFDLETRQTQHARPMQYRKPLPPMATDPNDESKSDIPF